MNLDFVSIASCKDDYKFFSNSCYKYFPGPRNWLQASEKCAQEFASLVSIENAGEDYFVKTLLVSRTISTFFLSFFPVLFFPSCFHASIHSFIHSFHPSLPPPSLSSFFPSVPPSIHPFFPLYSFILSFILFQQTTNQVDQAWIGLSDVNNPGTVNWIDGTQHVYGNYDLMQENIPGRKCGVTSTQTNWKYKPCDGSRGFVCRRRLRGATNITHSCLLDTVNRPF